MSILKKLEFELESLDRVIRSHKERLQKATEDRENATNQTMALLAQQQIDFNIGILSNAERERAILLRQIEEEKNKERATVEAKARTATDEFKNLNSSYKLKDGRGQQNPLTQNRGIDASGIDSKPLPKENIDRLKIIDTGMSGGGSFSIPGVTDFPTINTPVGYPNGDDVPRDDIVGANPVFPGGSTSAPIQYEIQPNPLDAYVNYTYGLTLHVLSKEDYMTLTTNPTAFKPTKTVISSASRYKNTRLENFKDDFYFDDFKMTTIVGLNTTTRGTNAIQVKFTLIEPYGLTLMDRLLDISTNEFSVANYLELPYLLEINFFGYTDDGEPQKLEDHTKFIPIRLIEIGIRASSKGSEYAVTAIPFNQIGNLQTLQAIKANFEISGRTVKDIFKNDLDSTEVQTAVREESERQRAAADANANAGVRVPTQNENTDSGTTGGMATMNSAAQPVVKVASFTGAYNLFNLYEQEHGNIEFADQIIFKIHEEIANSKVTEPETTSAKHTPAINPDATEMQNSTVTDTGVGSTNPNKNRAGPDFTKSIFNVNAGTSVIDFVNTIIINSEYITNQLEDPEKNRTHIKTAEDMLDAVGSSASHVNWFKIIPKVELLDFDKKRNKWAKRITYYVMPYRHYNARDGRAPLSQPPGAVKEYNYIYTGKNKDIIEFSMNFDTLYYTAIQVSRARMETTTVSQTADPRAVMNSSVVEPIPNSIMPTVNDITLGSHTSTLGIASTNSSKMNAMSFRDSIYTNAAGDMLQVKLKILGDPEFIKQDEIFFNPETAGASGTQYVAGANSIAMDDGEIYCIVNFKTPVDMDETTGLVREDSRYAVSGFSGYYRITEVETELYKGQFTQTLTMYRHPNQEVMAAQENNDSERV